MPSDPTTKVIKPRRRRIVRRLVRVFVFFFLVWFLGSGAAAYCLVHRVHAKFAEPAPIVSWAKLEEIRLTTDDGVGIGGWLNPAGGHPTIVLFLHGQGESRRRMLPRMAELAEHGYASMAISLRSHGDSDGTSFDFGYRADRDVIAAVHYLRQRFPGRPVVVAGNSLGSVSAIFAAAKLDHDVAGYFLESPYRDLLTAVKNRTEFVPPPFSESAYAGLRIWGRVLLTEDPSKVRPIDHVAEIPTDIPITFLAARGDRLCRLFEVEDLDRKVAAHASLIEVESARHGAISRTDPQIYYPQLLSLLAKTDGSQR
ncbi:MAG TPA: alpha/beta fold hydrolase [Humisphaera sp.]|nr:alpha/beta fold hydrolase [Humisphaera sp.]